MVGTEEATVIAIIAGGVIFSIMSFAMMYIVVSNKKKLLKAELEKKKKEIELNKEAQKSFILGKEKEKQDLGKYLHDELGGTATRLTYQLEAFSQNQSNKALLENSFELSKQIQLELRNLSSKLLPYRLNANSLEVAVANYLQDIKASMNLPIHLEVSSHPENATIEIEAKVMCFRIIQELITNYLKYGNKSDASLKLNHTHPLLSIYFSQNKPIKGDLVLGTGLNNLKAYTNFLNGKFIIENTSKFEVKIENLIVG